MLLRWLVAALLLGLALAQRLREDITEEELTRLAAENDLTENESYRCGVFFAGRRVNAKPREKIFILPRFNTTCPSEEPGLLGDECVGLFSQFLKRFTWNSPSRKRRAGGFSLGDDICALFKSKTNMTAVPNEKVRRGLQVGFYYNVCADRAWLDTGLRVDDRVCCDDDSKFVACRGKAAGGGGPPRRRRPGGSKNKIEDS